VVTDIYGGLEFRHPAHGNEWYDGEAWVKALDLWPLLDNGGPAGAYPAYAYLFGIRNHYGFDPIAAARGLPGDASGQVRGDLQKYIDTTELSASWVSWSELADLDMSGPFGPFEAWIDGAEIETRHTAKLLRAGWDAFDIEFAEPPVDLAKLSADAPLTWTTATMTYTIRELTLGTYFGPGTPWGHVFAVMRALGDRFGDDAVRLVAAFD
jgi:hypothetical protein